MLPSQYRNPEWVAEIANKIKNNTTQPWCLMEICGGQTNAIAKYGITDLLPEDIQLIHGPGCPVCVTPIHIINMAIEAASYPDTTLCTFGDMFAVPGSEQTLSSIKAKGGNVKIIYSPLDALYYAQQHPAKRVILLAIGFETTAPTYAQVVLLAQKLNLQNLFLLTSLVLVPPALEFLLTSERNKTQGFLAAGHVCAVMGEAEYQNVVIKHRVPITITGFEPVDILLGILDCIIMLENQNPCLTNQYNRAVHKKGNVIAQDAIKEVFEVVDTDWRGIGTIPASGLKIRDKYNQFDMLKQVGFNFSTALNTGNAQCIAGDILQGFKKPFECKNFGTNCTPTRPIGAPMVSQEGACAAYYRYKS